MPGSFIIERALPRREEHALLLLLLELVAIR